MCHVACMLFRSRLLIPRLPVPIFFVSSCPCYAPVFDSWGKVPPGLLKVYSNFRGEYMECKEIRVPPVVTSWDHLEDLSLKLDFASLEDLAEEQQRQLENGGKPELLTVHEGQVKLPEFKGKFCHVGVTVGGLDIAGGQARIVRIVCCCCRVCMCWVCFVVVFFIIF